MGSMMKTRSARRSSCRSFSSQKKRASGQRRGKPLDQRLLHPPVVFGHHVAPAGLVLGQHVMRLQDQRGGLPLGLAEQDQYFSVVHKLHPPGDCFDIIICGVFLRPVQGAAKLFSASSKFFSKYGKPFT